MSIIENVDNPFTSAFSQENSNRLEILSVSSIGIQGVFSERLGKRNTYRSGLPERNFNVQGLFPERTPRSISPLAKRENEQHRIAIILHKQYSTQVLNFEDRWGSIVEEFIITNLEVVKPFLKKNGFLLDLLLAARTKIAEYFSGVTPLVLYLAQYPDEGDEELYLLIQTKLSANESLLILDRFEEEWWLDILPKAQCKMTIKLEYI